MHIGRETDYALRIILYLVAQGPGAKVSAGRIAERMSVPERFNLKILRKLSMKGIVQSSRGIYGGFSLCRSPEELTLLEAIEALGEPDREILVRRYYLGQSAKEIGKAIKMRANTVDKRVERSLEKLRRQLRVEEWLE